MKNGRVSAALFSVLVILFLNTLSEAGEKRNKTFELSYLSSEEGISKEDQAVIDRFTEKLQSKGYKKNSKKASWKVFLNIYHPGKEDQGKTILCYHLSKTLPESIIEFGAKNEVFYLAAGRKREKGQSKEIREYMSADYLRQFSMVFDSKVYLADTAKIDSKLDEMVADLDKAMNLRP